MKYRKKPVVIEAMRHDTSSTASAMKTYQWVESLGAGSFDPDTEIPPPNGVTIDPGTGLMIIATLEGTMSVSHGDYVIRGVAGEFYPCKPDIFAATYEPVEP